MTSHSDPALRSSAFADTLRTHLSAWSGSAGLAGAVEPARPWVLRPEEARRNFFRPEWAAFITGREHLWARALNSSQCFGVNLFAPLVDDRLGALRFLSRLAPHRALGGADLVRVEFEASPDGVCGQVGESGHPTQIDVLFRVFRGEALRGAVGIEVKLGERAFGGCRGFNGDRDGRMLNPARERCLDGRRVLASPDSECFMAQAEGRRYWHWMTAAEGSFDLTRLVDREPCAFRHGLYQLMRNRVALDVLRNVYGAEWCDLAVCMHASNEAVALLPEPVAGHADVRDAFDAITRPGALLRWDALEVLETIEEVGAGPEGWARWMREKYLLEPADGASAPERAVPAPEPPRAAPGRWHAPDLPAPDPPAPALTVPDAASWAPAVRDPAPSGPAQIAFQRELRKRLADFLAHANLARIEKIGPKIEAVFLEGRSDSEANAAAIQRQLWRWVVTNPRGRYAGAIGSARALYDLLFDPDERARVEGKDRPDRGG